MDDGEDVFPMDVIDPSRPLNFRPQGYLVVILAGPEEAERAQAALVETGTDRRDIKSYTGEQILSNYESYLAARGLTARVVGAVVDDAEGRDLYLAYAREGRSAMWVRVPDESNVRKALRLLADHDYLHARYYGDETQTDFHIS